jgi:hypothetical protein
MKPPWSDPIQRKLEEIDLWVLKKWVRWISTGFQRISSALEAPSASVEID